MKKTLRIGGIARVSHDEQKKYGYSIDAQIDKIKKWCEEEKHQLVDLYIDEGYSASNMKRPNLQRLLKDLDKLDAVVFTRLDRFSRNVLDANRMLELFQKHNVALVSIEEDDIDTSTADGLFMFQLKVSLAERELKKGSERIKDVFEYKIKAGQPVTGAVPLGYKIETIDGAKKVVKDKQKEEMVNDIFNYFEKHHSINKVMLYVKDKYNLERCYRTFYRLFKNPIYVGIYHSNPTFTEPYITIEQFDRNQEIIKNNLRNRKKNYTHIFSGLIKCPVCKGKMAGAAFPSRKKDILYYYYRCPKKTVDKNCELERSVTEKEIENYLIENIEQLAKNHIYNVTQVKKNNKSNPEKRIKEIKEEMDNLNYMFQKKRTTKSNYDNEFEKLEKELKILQQNMPLKDDTKSIQAFLNSGWRNIYNNMERENKRALWINLIKEIKVDKDYNISIIFM